MMIRRFVLFFFLLSLSIPAKDVTYRLYQAEPLTFTIPDDWSSEWGPIMDFREDDPDAPADILAFGQTPDPVAEGALRPIDDPTPLLMIDARKRICPLAVIKQQLTEVDQTAQKIIPPKPLQSHTDQTHMGYYQIHRNHRPGIDRLDLIWNLGSGSWTAYIRYPAEQTHWIPTCVAIIESARLADPKIAPPTPKRPTRDGVEDPDFPEEAMEEWRSHHE